MIPDATRLLEGKAIEYSSLTDNEFDDIMERAVKSYYDGECKDFDDYKTDFMDFIK